LSLLAITIGIALYFSIIKGKLIISGISSISQIYGYIIGGILILGWVEFIYVNLYHNLTFNY
ncbi:hypothetical protein, partial [Sulfuracidifex metallicus]|uniref:hypothetical protein n=1 Tax=Sulfuracidifex metallicus TaxID=47303 RepID=UPI000A803A44